MRLSKAGWWLLWLWFALAVGEAIWRLIAYAQAHHYSASILAQFWLAGGVILPALFVVEWLSLKLMRPLKVKRMHNDTLALHVATPVNLYFEYQGKAPLLAEVYDLLPPTTRADRLPQTIALRPQQQITLAYQLTPLERGVIKLERVQLWLRGGLKLIYFRRELNCPSTAKVYPNYRSIQNYVLLASEQRTQEMGIRQRQQRGEGLEFHQLRDYRTGDSLRQIDWPATTRMRRLISREYQIERDQNIIFLLDNGRRMRTKDGDLSHFDQALNATLLTAYIALKQGDAVGMMTFGRETRWVPPKKGGVHINRLLQQSFDLHPQAVASDLVLAARQLNQQFRKRSLVILVSNLRSEDEAELNSAIRLLRKHHLLVVANMRETALDELLDRPVQNETQAMTLIQTLAYLRDRERMHYKLNQQGIIATDCIPRHLATRLVNQYFDIKRSGRL
jgi:uncharacterized protein (DUF58 family)